MPDVTDRPSLAQLVAGATQVLAEAGVPSPVHDARALAAHALGLERLPILDPELDADFTARFAALIERRRRREPLQHLVGSTGFRYLTLAVEPGVFVPRPETETVAQVAIDEANRLVAIGLSPIVVDLCCGAGGIAVSVAVEVPGSLVTAVDLSAAAVALTRRNARSAGVGALRLEQGDVREPDLLEDLDGTVDIVVSNPPYIPPDAVPIEPEVRDHDPDLALYGGGTDGLETPHAVMAAARRLLKPGGLFVMEHAEVQETAAQAAATHAGFTDVHTIEDLSGRPRAVVARQPD
ncbi:MAG: peptide chain release factor N(5)-glutamine methyltransferase [Propionibacteriaceae bacterium]|nr:peptide chain release factor N(5)-glutamine methyltransferase [Propionibacteriaceae bacterium]